MYLKSLELNGFKSFGKKSTLDFTTSITAIVGPNGSGKSNIAEAFRFVFGEQSLKSMRGKRGEDLIFNGSAESGRANRAGTKLVFDNSRRLLNIDFDEVSIERVVYRDGVNDYFINGSKVRLKDVVELLSSAHIGGSGHHIISQGEADRILHSNPKERREMIEDALGIKIYQYKKEESERKLEKTEENIKQVESLRREIAPHLRFLKKQVEKLEKAAEIRKELISLSHEYFRVEEECIERERKSIASLKETPEVELKELDKKLASAKKLVESNIAGEEKTPEIISIEENLHKIREEKDNLVRELGKIEGEISYINKSIDKEKQTLTEEGNQTVVLRDVEEVYKGVEEIIQLADRENTIESAKNALKKIKEAFFAFISGRKKATTSESLKTLQAEEKSLSVAKNDCDKRLSEARGNEQRTIALYEKKRLELEKVKDETREAEKEIFKIVAKQNELHALLDKVKSRESELHYRDETFKNDLKDISAVAGIEVLKFRREATAAMPLDDQDQRQKKVHIERLKIRLEESGVSGGEDVMKEFKETEERDQFLEKELEDLIKAGDDLRKLISELDEKLNQEFRDGVKKINDEFHKFFTLMFGGGHALLKVIKQERRVRSMEEELMDGGREKEEEAEEGIDIEVSLPHKKIKGLMMLSGGERALTSIALLFAISQVNPPPFVILDETDAALDEANSRKYGDMVESLSKHSQLIVITHNRETMSRAGILYGITMGKDATSKLLSIAFDEAVEVAK